MNVAKTQQNTNEVRNEIYNEYVKQKTPQSNLLFDMFKAFVVGGIICAIGQVIINIGMNMFDLSQEDAYIYCSIILVLFSCIFTSLNLYTKIANWSGAGALVPITGFANGVCSCACEFQVEGQVFGIGSQIFKIAGPVILYGILSSWIAGVIYYIFLV